jgi:DNA-directed RNA polymerase subunit M/transcription elongation factor TFIIS
MANFGGYGSEDSPRKDKKCPNCKKTGKVSYMGSTVTHGNPFSPAADTEVDHHFHCNNCKHVWDEYA